MFIKKHFSTVLFPTAAALALLSACTDKDFGYSGEDIKYAKAYQDFFGDLPEDKSWDLSSSVNHYHYDSNGYSGAATRANSVEPDGGQLQKGTQSAKSGQYYVCDNYWNVPQDTYDWLKAALKEGKDNRYLGSPFVLQLPENDFAIVPIFQGKSSITSALEVKVNGYAITTVWTRSSDIQVQDEDHQVNPDANGWMNIGFYDGFSDYSQSVIKEENAAKKNGTPLPKYPSYTDEADAVRSKPIYFRAKDYIGRSNKGFMYLSLHNIAKNFDTWANCDNLWDAKNDWTTIGHRLTSINPQGHMLALNVPSQYRPSPSELPNICEDGTTMPSQVIFVSCEDANGTSTDHDVNDVAFLIIGYPNAPTIVPTTEVIKKRYMCEDLGGTYDYDFNDIVVDVTQTQKYAVDAVPDVLDSYEEAEAGNITIRDMVPTGCPVQTAKIARLCGTIPLQLRIGDFMFPKINDPMAHENQWDGFDGRFDTRSDLCKDEYYLYSHKHCDACCAKHGSIGTGSNDRINYNHVNITRAGESLPENNNVTLGWNPNEEQVIPCHTWDPDKNNIIIYADWGYYKKLYNSATVNANGELNLKNSNPFPNNTQDFADFASGKKFPVAFPQNGEYPYIIATDVDVPWMKEEQHIPEEWIHGDMTARSNGTDGSNHDLIGNSYYMENYPKSDGEGYIWSGDVTGLAYSTGVTFANPSAELAAMKESFEHQYFLLHVYMDVPVGESASVGLYSADDWKPILTTDADGYYATALTNRLHDTYLGVDGLQCATIYLTTKQREDILNHGLVVVSRTDGVRIKKITTARPCMYDPSNPGEPTKTGSTVNVDAGFIVNITKSEVTNGWILSDESERLADIIEVEEGKVLTSEQQAHNSAEPGRVVVPFETRQFISGTTVTLTAIGKTVDNDHSYRVTGWQASYNNSFASDFELSNTNPLTIKCTNNTPWDWGDSRIKQITVYPTFAEANNPRLVWEENPTEASKTITLALDGSKPCKIYATSLNLSTGSKLDQFGGNTSIVGTEFDIENGKHVVKLTPNAVGETTFTIYQKDGEYSGTNYGVSGELKLTVKVIESMPTANYSMDNTFFYRWNAGSDVTSSYIVNDYSSLSIKNVTTVTSTDSDTKEVLFGDMNVWGHAYADLSDANTLIVGVAQGDIELIFNRAGEYGAETIVNAEHAACSVIYNNTDGSKAYVIDLTKLRTNGKTHFNAVREANGHVPTRITGIKVDNRDSEMGLSWKAITAKTSNATVNVDKNDIYQWNDRFSLNSQIVGQDRENYVFLTTKEENGKVVFGHKDSNPVHAITLCSANVLKVTANKANSNGVLFQFNKKDWSDRIDIKTQDWKYVAAKESGDNIIYTVDLDKVRDDNHVNYLYLAAINADYNHTLQISKIEVDSKESRAVNNYSRVQAVSSWTDLGIDQFHRYTDITGETVAQASGIGAEYHVGESAGNVYGHGSVPYDCYALLNGNTILKLVVEEGEPRILLNRKTDNNENPDYIEITPTNANKDWIYKVGNVYYVMLWPLQEIMHENIRLNAIKGANFAPVKVTSLQVGKP